MNREMPYVSPCRKHTHTLCCMWSAGMFDLDHSSGQEVGSESPEAVGASNCHVLQLLSSGLYSPTTTKHQTCCSLYVWAWVGACMFVVSETETPVGVNIRHDVQSSRPLSSRPKAKAGLPTRQGGSCPKNNRHH